MAFEKNNNVKLTKDSFRRMDEESDEKFYAIPRFTSHIDCFAMDAVTDLYRQYLPNNAVIVDLMSSLFSHLPDDVSYQRVVGLGMNARELANNKQLTETVVHDLNTEPTLPFNDDEFSAGLICVSIDYLVTPVDVLKEMGRALQSKAPLIITYSNRFFETKATAAWLSLTDEQRGYLIKTFLVEAGCFENIQMMDCSPEFGDPLYAVVAKVI